MYTLYWAPVTGSLAVQAALEGIGAPYRLQLVDTAAGAHREAEFLRIAPHGKVPALTDGDGRAYFESAALVMLLCDRHPEAGLAPTPDDPARGHYYQWLLYLADTIYPAYQRVYHRERFSTDVADSDRVAANTAGGQVSHSNVCGEIEEPGRRGASRRQEAPREHIRRRGMARPLRLTSLCARVGM